MSKTADDIKRYYGFKGIALVENENVDPRKGRCTQFWVEQKIWIDAKVPEYFVLIPENMKAFSDEYIQNWKPGLDIETRRLCYRPTGRAIYDNTLPPSRAVVWEYELYHERNLITRP